MPLSLTSPAFSHGGAIPERYTCDGSDVSPPLAWSGVPEGTKSLALVVDDPDAPDPKAPKMTWVHWVLYNLPSTAGALPEAVAPEALPPGTKQSLNDGRGPATAGRALPSDDTATSTNSMPLIQLSPAWSPRTKRSS